MTRRGRPLDFRLEPGGMVVHPSALGLGPPPSVVQAPGPPPVVTAEPEGGMGLLAKLALGLAGAGVVIAAAAKLAGASKDRLRAWKKKHRKNPRVRAWLRSHRPPRSWKGTPLEWAYTQMPFGPR